MTSNNIAEVVVPLPIDGPFDYSLTTAQKRILKIGMRVHVSFNRRLRVGYVVGLKADTELEALNPVLSVLDSAPMISSQILTLCREVADYYGCSFGEVIEVSLPRLLRTKRSTEFEFKAIPNTRNSQPSTHTLIHDVTLHDYWPEIEPLLKVNLRLRQSVIVLVPERKQILGLRKIIKKNLGVDVVEYSRAMSVKEEFETYCLVKQIRSCIVIGTRSAVFAPVQNLGQIIVFHEENEAYRQEQSPHYSAPHVAHIRCVQAMAKLTHISQNPRIELLDQAANQQWDLKSIPDNRGLDFQMVDMNNYNPRKSSLVSFPLQNAIQTVIAEEGQVLLYFNRRGFGTFTQCNRCGHVMRCQRCEASLVLNNSTKELACRKCNYKVSLPKKCPSCSGDMRSTGKGIEKMKENLERMYPHLFVDIFDKDTKSFPSKSQIIIATSAILRKMQSFKVDLVGVLQFDNELNRADFRSSHKAISLLLGLRHMVKKKFVVQTYMPENDCMQAIRTMNLAEFYENELKHRRELGLPPSQKLIVVMIRGPKEEIVVEVAAALYGRLDELAPDDLQVLESMPDVIPKLRDQYRYTIMLKCDSMRKLQDLVASGVREFRQRRGVIITTIVDA